MDGVLSQEEINALLNNNDAADSSDEILTESEKDAIGEIANISMGTAATTLFSLVNRRVEISTPVVSFSNWDKIVDEYEKPCVFIKIGYTQGLNGSNILVLKEKDVKIITDLMMGGDGTNINGEIGELHLSAISEAMNQMMGSSATSLSSMLNRTIDISPPIAEVVDLKNTLNEGEIDSFLSEEFVKISFHMEIGDLVDSEIMQLYPPAFVKEMCKGVSQNMELDTQSVTEDVPQSSNTATQAAPIQQPQDSGSMNNASANSQGMINENMMNSNMNSQNMMNQGMMNQNMGAQNMIGNQVNVQNAQFTPFGAMPNQVYQPENIDLIMDVPLEVTVELGRTKKSISEILFLTLFIMWPTFSQVNEKAIKPLDEGKITQQEAIKEAEGPFREFMYGQTQTKDIKLFVDISGDEYDDYDDVPFTTLVPAFILSELRTAFILGFLIYIPFIVIDMVVSSVLMSMGMMMLPPTTISMPFKVLLFILADGWDLVIGNLVKTFY